jgi:DNA polymerase III subunit epsilon
VYQDGSVIKSFSSLIDPERSLPLSVSNLTGITEGELRKAPTFNDVHKEVLGLLEGVIFVAHNVRFDYSFIKNEFNRLGVSFRARTLCTVQLSREVFFRHKRHDLSSIIARHNLACTHRHRAYDDAFVLVQFLQMVEKNVPEQKLQQILDKLLKAYTLPSNVKPNVLRTLPESTGVYMFYGSSGELLYVGKSINIKRRVQSHFSSDHAKNSQLEMIQQIHSIETIKTHSDVAATLLELQLIKEKEPFYNRASRRYKELVMLTERIDEKGYFSISIDRVSSIPPEKAIRILGLFRSERKAVEYVRELVKKHNLCEKRMGLEKGRGRCFQAQLEICKGACVGEEPFKHYNKRARSVFTKKTN